MSRPGRMGSADQRAKKSNDQQLPFMAQLQTICECRKDKTTRIGLCAFNRQTGRSRLHNQHQRPVCPRLDNSFSD